MLISWWSPEAQRISTSAKKTSTWSAEDNSIGFEQLVGFELVLESIYSRRILCVRSCVGSVGDVKEQVLLRRCFGFSGPRTAWGTHTLIDRGSRGHLLEVNN